MDDLCSVKMAFVRNYAEAAGAFSDAVVTLQKNSGIVQWIEYNQLYKITEHARKKADSARLTMERHVADHGC